MYLSPPILYHGENFITIEKNMREEWYDDDAYDR